MHARGSHDSRQPVITDSLWLRSPSTAKSCTRPWKTTFQRVPPAVLTEPSPTGRAHLFLSSQPCTLARERAPARRAGPPAPAPSEACGAYLLVPRPGGGTPHEPLSLPEPQRHPLPARDNELCPLCFAGLQEDQTLPGCWSRACPVRAGTPGRLHSSDHPEEQLRHGHGLHVGARPGGRRALSGRSKEHSGEVDTAPSG